MQATNSDMNGKQRTEGADGRASDWGLRALAHGYSAEDAQRILAISLSRSNERVSPSQLKEMADELLVDSADLAEAIEIWASEKAAEREKRDRRKAFYRQQLIPFLALNTFLMLLNISLSGAITWAIYPFLGTGVSLFFSPCRSSARASRCSLSGAA